MTTSVNSNVNGNGAALQSLMSAVNGTANQKKSASVIDEAQNRFLTLLTTQLRNQDPMNPMDNAQMTSQLAQISTVSGIERLNATLEKMLSSNLESETMQAAALVGRSVMVSGNALALTSAGAVGGFELSGTADQVNVTIKDANGLVVKPLPLGRQEGGLQNYVWDGSTDAGAAAVPGNYTVSIEARRGGEKLPVSALELASVVSVSRSSQGIDLNLGHQGLARMTDVKQIF